MNTTQHTYKQELNHQTLNGLIDGDGLRLMFLPVWCGGVIKLMVLPIVASDDVQLNDNHDRT